MAAKPEKGNDPKVRVKFWGTRGSIPTPGPTTLRYGGNTACVEMRWGDRILMLDCGTGAREMGLALQREFSGAALQIHLFVTHTHWDHIQGFPFFQPAYSPGSQLTVYSLAGADKSLEKVFTGQMDGSYFPVELGELPAQLKFVDLDGAVELGGVRVSHTEVNHPGQAIAYRIEVEGKALVYLTDHEAYCRQFGDTEANCRREGRLTDFARGADLYIREAQYTPEEYAQKRGWGHSTWVDALESAEQAQVKRVALFHHHPEHDDSAIEGIVGSCRALMTERGMGFECFAAADQQEVEF